METPDQQPQIDQATYRDLVIFEERLRGNMTRLQRRKRKFEALLVFILISLVYFFYKVFLVPSKLFAVHLANTAALLVAAGSLVVFYRSGMHSEKIVFAAEFVPHCNRALQHFNLQFNQQGQSGALQFCWAIPSEIQQGFESYRRQFIARKRARQAKLKAA
ncbi:hypothetical protein BCR43DRAFT_522878 [Syncephalastrum racemosum]|uniref:Transmembrane protein 188 n=1 Tax=Syncephalastrum racemosum TaxID=13706 RepID=A0A1X2HIA5_SYNRA|nr:hypothetical protein BCR43DRAFT_522878 [Syncephalastrum racemosum]